MDPHEVDVALRRRPFQPFRLHLSDGTAYEIRHPDQAVLSRRALHVGIGGNGTKIHQRIVVCAVVHITKIDPIEVTSGEQAD